MKILAYDIERVPAVSFHWSNHNISIPVGMIIKPGEMVSFAARWYGAPKNSIVYRSVWDDGVTGMLESVAELWDEADAVLTYNGTSFDRRHVQTELVKAKIDPPSPRAEIDLYRTVRRQFNFQSNKLDYVARELEVGAKMPHEGFGLWLKAMEGDPAARKRFQRYNEQDVHLLIDLYDRLIPWVVGHPNANLFGGEGCPKCGSADLQKRGTRPTNLGIYQRFQCKTCGSWSTSGKSIQRVDIRAEN